MQVPYMQHKCPMLNIITVDIRWLVVNKANSSITSNTARVNSPSQKRLNGC